MAKTGSGIAAIVAFLVTLAACGGSITPTPQTDVGITNDTILLGNTIAQSGPAAFYGTIVNAEYAYFTYINNTRGGVNGRKIAFKILNDGYNPTNTVALTKQLVEQDRVFAIFSGLGTQTQLSVRDYLNAQQVPQMFVATGATTFGADFSQHPYTIGWQPPYQGEARIYARDVAMNHAGARIGVLYQNDDYGQDYLKGLIEGLGSASSMIVDKESYDAAAASVSSQLSTLRAKGADTLFIFATPTLTAQSLGTLTSMRWEPAIYVNSVFNSQVYSVLANKAGAGPRKVTSVSYVKDPNDPRWATDDGMRLYKRVIASCSTCNVNDTLNIYGVAVAFTMVDVLTKAGSIMTRQNVMKIAGSDLNENNPFLLPGISVKTTVTDHRPIMQEQVITWNGTSWTPQGSLIDLRAILK